MIHYSFFSFLISLLLRFRFHIFVFSVWSLFSVICYLPSFSSFVHVCLFIPFCLSILFLFFFVSFSHSQTPCITLYILLFNITLLSFQPSSFHLFSIFQALPLPLSLGFFIFLYLLFSVAKLGCLIYITPSYHATAQRHSRCSFFSWHLGNRHQHYSSHAFQSLGFIRRATIHREAAAQHLKTRFPAPGRVPRQRFRTDRASRERGSRGQLAIAFCHASVYLALICWISSEHSCSPARPISYLWCCEEMSVSGSERKNTCSMLACAFSPSV